MNCPNCQHPIDSDVEFCPHCGVNLFAESIKIKIQQDPPPPSKQQPTPKHQQKTSRRRAFHGPSRSTGSPVKRRDDPIEEYKNRIAAEKARFSWRLFAKKAAKGLATVLLGLVTILLLIIMLMFLCLSCDAKNDVDRRAAIGGGMVVKNLLMGLGGLGAAAGVHYGSKKKK